MKVLILGSIIALLAITACGAPEEEVVEVTEETLPEGIIDVGNETCPVMLDPVMAGEYIDWEGFRIHFCCAGCDEDFLADPQQYLPILCQDPSVTVDFTSVVDCETIAACHSAMAECPDCTEEEMCEACAAMAEGCPDCTDEEMCEACAAMAEGCPDCTEDEMCEACAAMAEDQPMACH